MLRVPINHAQTGMRLALPVLHPQRGTKLLSEGYIIDDMLIARMRDLQIGTIWVEYPNTDEIKKFVSPAIVMQQSQVVELVASMLDPQQRQAHAVIDYIHYRRTVQGLIEALVNEPTAAAYIIEMGGPAASELRHASEVCYLSVLLGLRLQGYLIEQRKRLRPSDARDVVSLGIGAALHDIGMMRIAPNARQRYEQSRDESDPQWQKHVTLGHKMVSGNIPPAAAGVVLHHHQYFDGSGFPRSMGMDGRPCGLIGEEIHVFARIVCVADHFDRLRFGPDGTLQPRVRVLHQMLHGPLATRFDPIVLAALPLVVPAYPPGSVVGLSNGEQALVVQWHAEAPCQPTVQVLPGAGLMNEPGGSIVPLATAADQAVPPRYDLRNRTDLMIVQHEGLDVSGDNFRLIGDRLNRLTQLDREAA